jgi:CHAD domain-containing protein
VNNVPQETTVTIVLVPAGSERTKRPGVVLRADGGIDLPKIDGVPVDKRVFTATFYDTPRRRLARAGITLRRRMENGKNVWELELPREPEPLTLDAAGGPAGPPPILARVLSGLLHEGPLEEVRSVRTRRSGVRATDGGLETVEVLVDSKAVLDGRRIEREFTEILLRPLDSDDQRLRTLRKELRRAGARPVRKQKDEERSDLPGAAAVQAMLKRQHARMLAHDPGVRLGDDPEDVHQMRVATRRLRATLRAARRFFTDNETEAVRAELSWFADLLGSVRDLDVLVGQLREERSGLDLPAQAGAAHIVDLLVAEREAARSRLLNAMRTKRYLRLLVRVEELADAPPLGSSDVPVEEIARAEFKKLRAAAGSVDAHATDDELHRIRVRAKRARYAAEMAEPAVGKRARRFITNAKRLQDVAGELQDAVVAEERLRTVGERIVQPGAAFAAGRLVERARGRRAAAREAFPKAWSKVEKSGLQAWS